MGLDQFLPKLDHWGYITEVNLIAGGAVPKSSFRPTASASPKSGIPFPLIFSFPSVSLTGFDYP